DRVLPRADDEVVFLGRLDRQVKVRGLLIAPEEIEARLRAHPSVHEAAVVQRPLEASAERAGLVAFLVPRAGAAPPSTGELTEHLARALPRWMLPQRLEWLEDLPRTATGKVDLAALTERPLTRARPAAAVPTTAPEEAALLATIWARVLGV